MKCIKTLGLLALTAMAAMAFAATASATIVTSPENTTYTGKIAAASENKISTHGSNGVTIECDSKGEGEIKTHGVGSTVSGPVTSWSFPSCSGGTVLHVKQNGTLEIHASGSGNATVTSTGAQVEATTSSIFGSMTCIYSTNATTIGTLTGNKSGNAQLDANSTIPRTGGSALCGATGILTGSYKITTPGNLYVD